MSFYPRLFAMGERPRSAKRGAQGPAPSRKNTLWDGQAARKGELVITSAATGELLSSKEASQEQMGVFVAMKVGRLMDAAIDAGMDVTTPHQDERGRVRHGNCRGRRWLARASKHEAWAKAQTDGNSMRSMRKTEPCVTSL